MIWTALAWSSDCGGTDEDWQVRVKVRAEQALAVRILASPRLDRNGTPSYPVRSGPREAITKEFGVIRFAEVDWHPRPNVAPSQIVETITSVNVEKRLGPMRWGFVSPTAKELKLAPINARAATLPSSPMFQDAFRRYRWLVVADGLRGGSIPP